MPALMPDHDVQPPQERSELASFGEELRREREIRGISLKEIADATKVSKRFLEAIERNDHKTLPAPVFTRGFVREYARYLGLNSDDMVNRYNYAAAGDQNVEKSAHLERLTPPPPDPHPRAAAPKRGIPPSFARIDRNIYLLVVIAVALASVSWWAVKHRREAEAASEEVVAPSMAPARPAPAPTLPPPAPADDALRLTVDVIDDSWVTLEADGTTVINDEMHKGDHQTFTAKERFRFRAIGNAAGLSLMLNDAKLPPLGAKGEVVKNRVFDRDMLAEILSDEPRRE